MLQRNVHLRGRLLLARRSGQIIQIIKLQSVAQESVQSTLSKTDTVGTGSSCPS